MNPKFTTKLSFKSKTAQVIGSVYERSWAKQAELEKFQTGKQEQEAIFPGPLRRA